MTPIGGPFDSHGYWSDPKTYECQPMTDKPTASDADLVYWLRANAAAWNATSWEGESIAALRCEQAAARLEALSTENEKLKMLCSVTIRDEHEREREALKQARLSLSTTEGEMRKALGRVRSMLPQLRLDGQHKPQAMNAAKPNWVTGPGAAFLHDLNYIEEIVDAALAKEPEKDTTPSPAGGLESALLSLVSFIEEQTKDAFPELAKALKPQYDALRALSHPKE